MKKIQIALVSKETLPVFYIINEFMPDEVYLIGTKETMTQMDSIKEVAGGIGVVCHEKQTFAYDVQETINICETIHAENGGECDFCYNLTGGTKLMAIGAQLCAQSHNAKMVYSDTKEYTDLNDFQRKPILKRLNIETIVALQGQRIKSREVYAPDAEKTACANEIKHFEQTNKRAYHSLISFYLKYKRAPNSYDYNKTVYYKEDDLAWVKMSGRICFSSRYPGIFKMLFEGRWWETLVADAVAKWAGPDNGVLTSVVFEPKEVSSEYNKAKNEVDVLVNIGNVFLFVECKSGMFTQDNIYKLSTVCRTYGSYKSKGVVIAYSKDNITQGLIEKAKDSKIEILVPNKTMSNIPQELNRIVKSLNS